MPKDDTKKDTTKMTEEDKAKSAEVFAELEKMLGAVLNLLASHKQYAGMTLAAFHTRLLPPIVTKQFRLVRGNDGNAVAFVAWANVSDIILRRLETGEDITKPSDWQGGDNTVIIDLVAPNPRAGSLLVQKVKDELFPDKPLKARQFKDEKSSWVDVEKSVTN